MSEVKDWVYDIETYPNCFTMAILRADGKHRRVFEISQYQNDVDAFMRCLEYLRVSNCRMVGFNNIGFDYPIIHRMLEVYRDGDFPKTGRMGAKFAHTLCEKQINATKGGGFPNTVRERDVLIPQLDLYKIHHFDNKARATSLKLLEFNMRSPNIEDLPYEVGTNLTEEQVLNLKKYNMHDVEETLKFYHATEKMISFREELTDRYGRNFLNHNDTKIGKDYFIMKLEEEIPGSCYTDGHGGGRKPRQTVRESINLKGCVFDYYDFKRPEFQAVLEWFKSQTITETKGVFTDILENNLGPVAPYAEKRTKRQKFVGSQKPTEEQIAIRKGKHPAGWVTEVPLKNPKTPFSYWWNWNVADNLNVVVDGFRFDFGTGGIHGSITDKVVREKGDWVIVDVDVASMYPNIAIANRVYPEHLSEQFCEIYEDVYNQRKSFPKGTVENAMLKLALNGVYGDSNNQYSPFYDPQYTMAITINGQLSLCLLAEKLMEVKTLKLIQVNTDGVTFVVKKQHEKEFQKVASDWEKQVGLQLEEVRYRQMLIRDVNNYLCEYTNGDMKRKGAYEYENLGWHQNQSCLVVPKAVEAAMIRGEDLEEFIRNHDDVMDFMLRAKVPRNSRLVMVDSEGNDIPQQNICRYYACKSGGKLVKIMPPLPKKDTERRISIEAVYNVKTCNNMVDFAGDIDYDYYINEAKKLLIGKFKEEYEVG